MYFRVLLHHELFCDILMGAMFGSSLPPVDCRRARVLFQYMCCFCLRIVVFCFLRLVYPILPVFLDCPFLIAHSVFSNVYLTGLWIKGYYI